MITMIDPQIKQWHCDVGVSQWWLNAPFKPQQARGVLAASFSPKKKLRSSKDLNKQLFLHLIYIFGGAFLKQGCFEALICIKTERTKDVRFTLFHLFITTQLSIMLVPFSPFYTSFLNRTSVHHSDSFYWWLWCHLTNFKCQIIIFGDKWDRSWYFIGPVAIGRAWEQQDVDVGCWGLPFFFF